MEATDLPVLGLVLIQEGEAGLIEFAEEFVAIDRIQGLIPRW
jgi:hypothetical protein